MDQKNVRWHHLSRALWFLGLLAAFGILAGKEKDSTLILMLLLVVAVIAGFFCFHVYRFIKSSWKETVPIGLPASEAQALVNQKSRKYPLAAVLVSLFLLAFNAVEIKYGGRYFGEVWIIAPPLLLFGIGGLINPKICFALRKDIQGISPAERAWAFILSLGGLAIGLALLYLVR